MAVAPAPIGSSPDLSDTIVEDIRPSDRNIFDSRRDVHGVRNAKPINHNAPPPLHPGKGAIGMTEETVADLLAEEGEEEDDENQEGGEEEDEEDALAHAVSILTEVR